MEVLIDPSEVEDDTDDNNNKGAIVSIFENYKREYHIDNEYNKKNKNME
jgi:hypothetical protein